MNLITLFRRRSSAPVARERLQVLLAHERALTGRSDLLATLQDEILAVIAKHFTIDRDKVQIKLDRGETGLDAGDRRRSAQPRQVEGGGLGLMRCGQTVTDWLNIAVVSWRRVSRRGDPRFR